MSIDDLPPGQPHTVDGRGLLPPEPMELVLDALNQLPEGDHVLFLIHVEPRPLFHVLRDNGFRHCCDQAPEGHFEVRIWHAA